MGVRFKDNGRRTAAVYSSEPINGFNYVVTKYGYQFKSALYCDGKYICVYSICPTIGKAKQRGDEYVKYSNNTSKIMLRLKAFISLGYCPLIAARIITNRAIPIQSLFPV